MEITASKYLENLIRVRDSIPVVVSEIVMKNEDKITGLNIDQISRHQNSEEGVLENRDKTFTGHYKPATIAFAKQGIPSLPITTKTVGSAYNFTWDGDFFRQFKLLKDGNDFSLFSDGQNTNPFKKKFFDGYDNLYGLNNKNEEILNWEIIYPELLEHINKYL